MNSNGNNDILLWRGPTNSTATWPAFTAVWKWVTSRSKLDLNKAHLICDAFIIIIFVCFRTRRHDTTFWKKKSFIFPYIFFLLLSHAHYNVIKWQIYKIKLSTDAYTSLHHDQTQKKSMCNLNTCFYITLKSSHSFYALCIIVNLCLFTDKYIFFHFQEVL